MPCNLVVYRATVIGAGPAGLACVGNLLDTLPSSDKILWIDPQFQVGRFSSYPSVPSNTKTCLFTKFAEECKSFDSANLKSLKILKEKLDGQKGCRLGFAGELCQEITEKLLGKVSSLRDTVVSLKHENDLWMIKTENESVSFKSKMIFLTTGSHPKKLNISFDSDSDFIELDDALNPDRLNQKIVNYKSVSVYGSSHSAMLVLKNLLRSSEKNIEIINYYRQPVKFASFPDPIGCPDKILHDNTGLKGEVAEWVKTWIDLDEEELKSKFNLSRIRILSDNNEKVNENNKQKQINEKSNPHPHPHQHKHQLKKQNVNIYAVGYERNPLPQISYNHSTLHPQEIDYTPLGQLTNNSIALPGIFGYGIAFPERVKDLDGSDEAAVGLWKFMKHIKNCINKIYNKV